LTSNSNRTEKEYDFIIVGQGLAGTCLCKELLDRGKKVLVIDSPELPSSSIIAGGLFNPVTGRNMVLTWKAHELFSCLQPFYKKFEEILGKKLIYNMPLFRPFANNLELNEWQGKSIDQRFMPFIDFITDKPYKPEFIRNDLGGIMFKQTGYLKIKTLLEGYRSLLKKQNKLIEEEFIHEKINFNADSIVYKEYLASKIILCDGPIGFGNKLLRNIRFHPLKGEVLRLNIDYESNFILNRNAFVLPHEGQYMAGSNYELNDTSWQPTSKAREEITAKIDKILNIPYEVIDQRAGLRPTTHDRRPVVGILPNYPHIGVFNGLGTKGISLAPYFARQFAEYLVDGAEIEAETKIGRFFD
jgi:glycine oxidase